MDDLLYFDYSNKNSKIAISFFGYAKVLMEMATKAFLILKPIEKKIKNGKTRTEVFYNEYGYAAEATEDGFLIKGT